MCDLGCQDKQVAVLLNLILTQRIEEKMSTFKENCHDLVKERYHQLLVVSHDEQCIREIREARTLRFISAIGRLERDPI